MQLYVMAQILFLSPLCYVLITTIMIDNGFRKMSAFKLLVTINIIK